MNTPIRVWSGRFWLPALLLSVAASVATAQDTPPPPPPPPPFPSAAPTRPYTYAPSQAYTPPTPIVASPEALALAKNNNQFALDLYHQFNPKPDENTFFSPYSISTALAMTMAGARNETATQMAKTLHLAGLSSDAMAANFNALQKTLAEAQPRSGVELDVANSLWPEQNPEHPLLPEFLNLVQSNFDSGVFPVDFKTHADDAARQINTWVAENTKDKIKDVLHPSDLDDSTRLVLVNAIYFKAAWAFPFQPYNNLNDEFHLADGSSKPAVLMHMTFGGGIQFAGYADFKDAAVPFQMLSLNYFGTPADNNPPPRGARRGSGTFRNPMGPDGQLFSFIVLLPRTTDGLAALEKSLTADQLSTWLGKLDGRDRVEVFLPKFKLAERYSLIPTLDSMGVKNAFVDPIKYLNDPNRADFSGMDNARDLYIGLVIHQTFLDVDEKGTEAAAATVIRVGAGGAARGPSPPPPPIFRADHPFLFLIRDNTTGSILFLGQLANPEPMHEVIQTRPTFGRGRGPRGTAGNNYPPPPLPPAPITTQSQ